MRLKAKLKSKGKSKAKSKARLKAKPKSGSTALHVRRKDYINLNEEIPQYFCSNKSFLKSHFQKCIRRGLTRKALLTGYLWWEENISDFLRRLP